MKATICVIFQFPSHQNRNIRLIQSVGYFGQSIWDVLYSKKKGKIIPEKFKRKKNT